MRDDAIRVENLGKMYRIGAAKERHDTLRDAMVHGARQLLRRNGHNAQEQEFWALKDVSFEIKRGEVVGVIGRNGAGKSTLLKILSRITEPTTGRADLFGRVGSLLEVGTGFHPELTGRENIYLNGAILGMQRTEIARRFDEIVAFAEIDQFLDTPVKRYSSGMYVRLAFAVAAHLESEILLVDEVLAVGDAAFQQKCLGKMGDVASEGRTVVFVSHNMGAISSLTRRCMWLGNASVAASGNTDDVIQAYFDDNITLRRHESIGVLDPFRRDSKPSDYVRFAAIWANDRSDQLPLLSRGDSIGIHIELDVSRGIADTYLDFRIKNRRGDCVALFVSKDKGLALNLAVGLRVVEATISGLPLAPGLYYADFGINRSESTRAYDVILDYPLFEVQGRDDIAYWRDRPWGALDWSDVSWKVANGTS